MSKPILIPLDGSSHSERILEALSPLLEGDPVEVVLLRVLPLGAEDQVAEARKASSSILTKLAERGLDVRQRVEFGDPAGKIVELAEEEGAQLVAMTTHGRTGAERLLRGSVAERVLRACPVPLLLSNPRVLNEGVKPFQHILVPLDGSALSSQVLFLVESFAKAFGAKVTLFRVEPFVSPNVPSPLVHQDHIWDPSATKASLEPHAERLREAGIEVEVKAAYGIEASEILVAAQKADLVAMTTHGRSGVSRWWFGSVAESVVRHCSCPLLVLRAPTA